MSQKSLPPPAACIFDLDGTLVDSLQDIAEAANECLELLGIPPRPIADYRYLVGEGVPMLVQRLLGESHPHYVARCTELLRPAYRTRALRHTRPYAGVAELVARMHGRGVPLAVLSNKPHDMTVRIVRTFWPEAFAAVQGYVDERYRKPSPHHAREICAALGVAPAATWVIGDTPTDVATARALGGVAIGVTWGFRTRADLAAAGADRIVDRPDELG